MALAGGHNALLNPRCKFFAAELTARHGEHDSLLLVHGGGQLVAVQQEECFKRCVTGSLIAIEERMILNEEIPEEPRPIRRAWDRGPDRQRTAAAARQRTRDCPDPAVQGRRLTA